MRHRHGKEAAAECLALLAKLVVVLGLVLDQPSQRLRSPLLCVDSGQCKIAFTAACGAGAWTKAGAQTEPGPRRS